MAADPRPLVMHLVYRFDTGGLENGLVFFNTAFISKNGFESGMMKWVVPEDSGLVVEANASLQYKVDGGTGTSLVPLQLYYGPNDYKILKSYNYELENLVNLGQAMFAFVKYINRWIVLPVFDIIKGFV